MKTIKIPLSILFCCYYLAGMAQIPQTDLVGYWPFNGNANEYLAEENNGTLEGVTLVPDRCGNANSAYLFDGIDDYILCGTDSMGITDEISISCWVKKEDGNTDIAISKYDHFSADTGYNIQFDLNGAPEIRGRDRNEEFSESNNDGVFLYDDKWHHIVGIVDGSTWSVYVDTLLVGTYDNDHSTVYIGGSANPLSFGRRSYFETTIGSWNYFEGILDDIAIYKRAITEDEIVQLFNNDCSFVSSVCENNSSVAFELYPIPSSNGLIHFISSEPVNSVFVYDNLGRYILNEFFYNVNSGAFYFDGLSKGIYVFHIELESHQIIQRTVLINK